MLCDIELEQYLGEQKMTKIFFPWISDSKLSRVNSMLDIGSAQRQNANDDKNNKIFSDDFIVSVFLQES